MTPDVHDTRLLRSDSADEAPGRVLAPDALANRRMVKPPLGDRLESPVTVIIATYNRSKYIAQSLASVLGQSRPPAQVIVVDDGSTDDTQNVLAAYDDRIEYIRKKNGGKSTALNFFELRGHNI